MKKKLLAVLLCCILVILTGCNGKSQGGQTNALNTYKRESMFEFIPEVKQTPENMFLCVEKNGGVFITDCMSNEKAINIPEKIDGKSVLYVDLSSKDYIEVIMPDSVLDFQLSSTVKYANLPASSNGTYFRKKFGDGIERVYVDDGKTSLPTLAFSGCKLSSISLPGSLRMIGNSAFYRCNNLTEVKIPNNVVEIKYGAFSECYNLKNIMIPQSVIDIGEDAFSGCESLETIELPDNLSELGEYAFERCRNLKSITLPGSLKVVGRLFNGCASLEHITFSEGTRVIYQLYGGSLGDSNGYYGSGKTIEVDLPNSIALLPKFGDGVYSPEHDFDSFKTLGNFKVNYSGKTYNESNMNELYELVNESEKKTINGMTINKGLLLYADENIEEAIIPEGVELMLRTTNLDNDNWLYKQARGFFGCDKLKKVVFPSTMRYIGVKSMFRGRYLCGNFENVEEIVLNDGLYEIGEGAFVNVKLDELKLPDSVRIVGNRAFTNCDIKNLVLNDGLLICGDYAFQGQTVSEYFPAGDNTKPGANVSVIPDSVIDLGICPFIRNGAITSLKIGKGVSTLEENYNTEEGALAGCVNLKQLEMPNVVSIDGYTFEGCENLETLKLSDNARFAFDDWDTGFGNSGKLTVEYRGLTYSGDKLNDLYEFFSMTNIIQ